MSVTIRNMGTPDADKGDIVAAGIGQNATGTLEFGRVYSGNITSAKHGDGMYTVKIDKINASVDCRWAVGVFAPLLGIRTNYLPPVQSRVAVLFNKDGPSWIIASIPSEVYDKPAGKAKTITGMGAPDLPTSTMRQKGVGLNVTKPNDFLEGEYEITNNFGVAVQFLTTLVKMQGSERAKIEASLLDDMVRIVSDTFKHFSAFGDFQIYNDGRLNVRWDGTSYEHESFGKESKDDAKVELDDKKVSFEDTFKETGRWRFSQFLGFLGDFIHVFVTEPADVLGNIAEDAIRPGKSRVHLHSDGTILMQSTAEIALERVVRIVVPVEKKRFDDPEGNKKDEIDSLEKSFLELWEYGKDMKKAHYATYQLRRYARWLSCYHSYARFHQMSQEWGIPTESSLAGEKKAPTWFNQEEDVEQANSGKEESYDAYATIRIMRDGAILLMDHFGSAISMVRGSIQMSATRHIDISAAGDIRMDAGQNIYIKARRNIEIVAVVGGLTLKARAWWKAFCEWGTVWIKSNAPDPAKDDPETPVDETQDPRPEVRGAAILLEAAEGQMLLQSERRMTLSAIGSPDDNASETDTTASVLLQSRSQDVRCVGNRSIIMKAIGSSEGKLVLDSAKAIVAKCRKFLMDATVFDIKKKFTWKNSILTVTQIRSPQAHFQRTVSGPQYPGHPIPSSGPMPPPHGNHLLEFKEESTPMKFAEAEDTVELDEYESGSVKEVKPHEDNGDPPDGPDWAFFQEDKEYGQSGFKQEPKEDEMFQPLAQQRLMDISDDFNDSTGYDSWDWDQDNKLKGSKRVDTSSLPFPGQGAKEKVCDDGEPLYKPLSEDYSEQVPGREEDPTNESITRKFLKYE